MLRGVARACAYAGVGGGGEGGEYTHGAGVEADRPRARMQTVAIIREPQLRGNFPVTDRATINNLY